MNHPLNLVKFNTLFDKPLSGFILEKDLDTLPYIKREETVDPAAIIIDAVVQVNLDRPHQFSSMAVYGSSSRNLHDLAKQLSEIDGVSYTQVIARGTVTASYIKGNQGGLTMPKPMAGALKKFMTETENRKKDLEYSTLVGFRISGFLGLTGYTSKSNLERIPGAIETTENVGRPVFPHLCLKVQKGLESFTVLAKDKKQLESLAEALSSIVGVEYVDADYNGSLLGRYEKSKKVFHDPRLLSNTVATGLEHT